MDFSGVRISASRFFMFSSKLSLQNQTIVLFL